MCIYAANKPAVKQGGSLGKSPSGGGGGAPARAHVDPEVLKKRAERFGVTTAQAAPIVLSAEEEARRKARAERFSTGK